MFCTAGFLVFLLLSHFFSIFSARHQIRKSRRVFLLPPTIRPCREKAIAQGNAVPHTYISNDVLVLSALSLHFVPPCVMQINLCGIPSSRLTGARKQGDFQQRQERLPKSEKSSQNKCSRRIVPFTDSSKQEWTHLRHSS